MEENKNEEIIKKQKITIIILSICLTLSIIIFLGFLGFYLTDKNTIKITYADCYNNPNSFYTCFVVNIISNSDKTLKVNDFTFKCDEGNVCMSYVEYNNNTYKSGESFVVYKNTTNTLTFYATLLENSETNKIYYKLTPIEILNTIKKSSSQQLDFFLHKFYF